MNYVRAIMMRFPIIGNYADTIILILYIAVALLSLPSYKINKWDIIFLFTVTIVFLAEWAFYKDGREYLNRYMIDFVVEILPLYVVGVSLSASKDKDKIFHQLYILSIITLIANIFYANAFGTSMSAAVSKYQGDMNRAYALLPHCCLIAYHAVKKTNVWNVLFTAISTFYLLMLGTRGAAMIYLICIVLLLII
ncbi:MAG: hypothetical protein K2G60_02995, partial [Oscillospiraceae bacterium]|nr:hypothetical protein [Oscillospiraceae bacterium]